MSYVLPPPKVRPMTLSNRSVVGRHRIFEVLHQDVTASDGSPRRDVFTLECPDWCNVIAVTPAREILFIWQYRFGTDAMELEIPGGVIERGEAPLAAARRELREETGYESDAIVSLGSTAPNPAIQGNTCHFFVAENARPTGATHFDEHEEIEVVPVPVNAVAELIDRGVVRHSLAALALERYLRRTK